MNNSNSISYKNYLDKIKDDIAAGSTHRIVAKSNSMQPFIVRGRDELILQQTDKHSFKKGAILLAELGSVNHVLHRLVKIEGDNLVLRGDANLNRTELCGRNDIIAEVVTVVRNGKLIKKGSPGWNFYRYFWPSSTLLRRILLRFYGSSSGDKYVPTKPIDKKTDV